MSGTSQGTASGAPVQVPVTGPMCVAHPAGTQAVAAGRAGVADVAGSGGRRQAVVGGS